MTMLETRTTQPLAEIKPEDTSVTRITDPADLAEWTTTFRRIFPGQEEDFETEYFIRQLLRTDKQIVESDFLLQRAPDNTPIGVRWIVHNSELGSALVPYGGVIPELQGKGMYPHIVKKSEEIMLANGIGVVSLECKHPLQVDDETPEDARRRLRFFQNQGYHFVDPNHVPYLRHGAHVEDNNYQTIVDKRFIFGFKFLGDASPFIVTHQDEKKYAHKETVRTLYTNAMQLETDSLDPGEMKQRFPAIQRYHLQLDEYPSPLIPLIPAVPRNTIQ